MKNLFSLIILGLLVVSFIGAVSAKTDIVGIIYNDDYSQTIGGADVVIACVHNNVTSVNTTTSASDGAYGVEFYDSECTTGDIVTVIASKDDLSGTETGIVHNFGLTIKVAIINIPMVPEFGLIIGALTLLSAMVVFFVVRKE